jgi:circadian clock protein KaiC
MSDNVQIRQLASGVPGLDDVLGGGIPEFSLNLIAGGPGAGKTTLGHQIMFATASPQRKALYFSIVGEPPIKMLRYQQQYSFYDTAKLAEAIRFIYLGDEALEGGLAKALEVIVSEVKKSEPGIVVVDSFRSVVRRTLAEAEGDLALEHFMQRLALLMTSWEATTFLLGEYGDSESDNAVFTVADSILRLYQSIERNSVVRKLQVMKIRGQGQIPGLHTARISDDGYSVFPRLLKPEERKEGDRPLEDRLSTGSPSLDEMMGGGIPRGYSMLLAGPSGSGKTVLSNQFIVEGVRCGEPGIVAIFEKRPNDYLQTTPQGEEFERMVSAKKLEILYLRPLDLSIDETMLALREAVLRIGAKRAVIDSLSGLELALAPTFREDFRESLYRMVGALTALGVTVMSTVELADSYTDLRFSPHGIAFLTDAILMQRYVELDGQLRRALSVVKIRASQHSKDLREYDINSEGLLVVGKKIEGYGGILTGTPFKSKGKRDGDPEAG